MKMGPIISVRENSSAAAAGIVWQEMLIEQVDGKTLGEGSTSAESGTRTTLPDYLRRAASRPESRSGIGRLRELDAHRVEDQVKCV